MPRSRSSRPSPGKHLTSIFSRLARAVRGPASDLTRAGGGRSQEQAYLFEQLEQRLQFVILGPADGLMEYLDAKLNTIRVAWHDMTVELFAVGVGTPDPSSPYPPDVSTLEPIVPGSALLNMPPPTIGANLFTIYVLNSRPDSWFEAALVPPITATGGRGEEPFTGSAGPFSINAADGTGTISFSPPGDSGVALLGALHTALGDATQPIFTVPDGNNNAIGPRSPLFESGGQITAGLYMSPIALQQNPADPIDPTDFVPVTRVVNGVTYDTPNDIGYFHWAGTMFGNIIIQSPAAAGDSVAPPSQDNSADPVLNSQGGNIGEFYAGCVLTGNANGNPTPALEADISGETPNFIVDGDIRDLVTSGPIGGDPDGGSTAVPLYLTGSYVQIQGTVGQIYLREGNFIGGLDVEHLPSVYGLPDNIFTEPELEVKPNGPANGDGGVGPIFRGIGTIGGVAIGFPDLPTPFNNDTPSTIVGNANAIGTPQYLGSIKLTDPKTGLPLLDADGNQEYAAEVTGNEQQGDTSDNYAVPLLAGQPIAIITDVPVEVIDPDGRIVASNLNAIGNSFQYTPDRPGEYTVQVLDLVGAYTMEIAGVGDMALGTLSIPGGSQSDAGVSNSLRVENGDMGAVVAGVGVVSGVANAIDSLTPPVASIAVPNGNLREVKGASVGVFTPATATAAASFGVEPTVSVPDGTLGLVEGFNPGGVCAVETLFDLNNLVSQQLATPSVPFEAIGGDIQRLDGAGLLWADVATNQAIGVINAGSMATAQEASFFDVNADNIGNDGIIDLIDVTGDLGSPVSGVGPGIVTHDGGYVRYMHVGGTIFQDSFFGGGQPTNVTYDPGQTVSLTDDTGATLQFLPQGPVTTLSIPNPNDTFVAENATFGPQVNVTTFGIRDKGGPVIVNVSVTNNFVSGVAETLFGGGTATLTGQAEGLIINSSSNGAANTEADISSIGLEGESTTTVGLATNATTGLAVVDADGEQELAVNTPAAATALNTLSLTISGSAKVDVMSIVGFQQTAGVPADITNIQNNTSGEILGITGASIGAVVSGGSIGVAMHTTPMAIVATQTFGNALSWNTALNQPTGAGGAEGNAFPFSDQGFGVVATGNILSLTSNEAVGNVFDSGGAIGSIVADANGKVNPGVFSGINGPIVAGDTTAPATSRILSVSIGQGMLFSGTGAVGFSGVYAFGDIGLITNNGKAQADVRGNIVSETTIDNISLNNGSLINSEIIGDMAPAGTTAALADFARTDLTTTVGFALQALVSTINSPIDQVRQINIGGNGGILSSDILAGNTGPITVGKQGFGIFTTLITTGGDGVIGTITAGGYGIRDCDIEGGAVIQGLNATGNGSQMPVTNFGTDVRPSDLSSNDGFDPFTGAVVSQLDDLNAALGTSAQTPVIGTATDTGVLEDDDVIGSTTLGNISAQIIRTASPVFQPIPLPEEPAPTIPVVGQIFPMEFSVAGSIGNVSVRGVIDGLEITTGRLGKFTERGSVSRLGISVAGAIDSMVIHGNFGQIINDPLTNDLIPDSYIMATGAEGSIKSLTIDGDLNANVDAFNTIGKMTVNGNVNGSITAQGQTPGLTLGYLRVLGSIRDGSVNINGNAGTIITNGSLGDTTGSITIGGNLASLSVGASHQRNSSLASPLHVEGTVGSITVYGRIDGAVTIDGDIKTLKVTNDGTQANVINGTFTVGGLWGKAQITGGNIAANITANNTISSFTLTRGSVLFGSTIQSQINSITNFRITGGLAFGMFGSLLAPSGTNQSFDISGNVGDGTDAASIVAATGNKFRVRGSIVNAATIAVTGQLNSLQVDHNIETGALVSAHPLKKLKVGGTNTGTVITV